MDKISLKIALETNMWKMVWVGEPSRKVEVEMTYDELIQIVKFLKEQEVE